MMTMFHDAPATTLGIAEIADADTGAVFRSWSA